MNRDFIDGSLKKIERLRGFIVNFLLFVLLLLGMATFASIPQYILHIDVANLSQKAKIIYNLFCDIIFIFIIFFIYKDRLIKEFKSFIHQFGENFDLCFKYYLVGFIGMVASNLIITSFVSGASANNEELVREMIQEFPIYMIFSTVIYAPIVEETIFRRCIKDTVLSFGNNKVTKYVFVLLSGLIFASLHVIGVSDSALDYLYIIPYLSLGVCFALIYYKTDNLFSSMMLHAIHNGIAVLLYLVAMRFLA